MPFLVLVLVLVRVLVLALLLAFALLLVLIQLLPRGRQQRRGRPLRALELRRADVGL